MRFLLKNFIALSFETRQPISIDATVDLLNKSFSIKQAVIERLKVSFADEVAIARRSADKKALYRIDKRMKELVRHETQERIVMDVLSNQYWFEMDKCMELLDFAYKSAGGIYAVGVNHFVNANGNIRIFGAKI
jgi:hypothetical protein